MEIKKVTLAGLKTKEDIKADVEGISQYEGKKLQYVYQLTSVDYNDNGYISKITFSEGTLKEIDI